MPAPAKDILEDYIPAGATRVGNREIFEWTGSDRSGSLCRIYFAGSGNLAPSNEYGASYLPRPHWTFQNLQLRPGLGTVRVYRMNGPFIPKPVLAEYNLTGLAEGITYWVRIEMKIEGEVKGQWSGNLVLEWTQPNGTSGNSKWQPISLETLNPRSRRYFVLPICGFRILPGTIDPKFSFKLTEQPLHKYYRKSTLVIRAVTFETT